MDFPHSESHSSKVSKMKFPRIGVGILVLRKNKILLGERINAHGSGTWGPPGGHLEFGESPQACVARELEEETGLVAEKVVVGPWTNDFFKKEGKHYVTLYMIVPKFKGMPSVKEPDKCMKWEWFTWDNLPAALFLTLSNLIEENSLEHLLSEYLLIPQ